MSTTVESSITNLIRVYDEKEAGHLYRYSADAQGQLTLRSKFARVFTWIGHYVFRMSYSEVFEKAITVSLQSLKTEGEGVFERKIKEIKSQSDAQVQKINEALCGVDGFFAEQNQYHSGGPTHQQEIATTFSRIIEKAEKETKELQEQATKTANFHRFSIEQPAGYFCLSPEEQEAQRENMLSKLQEHLGEFVGRLRDIFGKDLEVEFQRYKESKPEVGKSVRRVDDEKIGCQFRTALYDKNNRASNIIVSTRAVISRPGVPGSIEINPSIIYYSLTTAKNSGGSLICDCFGTVKFNNASDELLGLFKGRVQIAENRARGLLEKTKASLSSSNPSL
ncbi:MAG: hypothetical protein P4L16_00285 [Chlamydiales bacterium]|nr:hypothetical protein [Chlamydiales bacterium]